MADRRVVLPVERRDGAAATFLCAAGMNYPTSSFPWGRSAGSSSGVDWKMVEMGLTGSVSDREKSLMSEWSEESFPYFQASMEASLPLGI